MLSGTLYKIALGYLTAGRTGLILVSNSGTFFSSWRSVSLSVLLFEMIAIPFFSFLIVLIFFEKFAAVWYAF